MAVPDDEIADRRQLERLLRLLAVGEVPGGSAIEDTEVVSAKGIVGGVGHRI